ncbi:MAG: hypothetical protein ACE5H4_05220 [Candidatus Thorarchaeota archaeon]
MTTAIILFIFTVLIARFMRQRRWWLRVHRLIATLGAAVVAGFFAAFYMVSLGEGVHFFYPHTWIGAASLVLAVITALTGYSRARLGLTRERHLLVHRLLALLTIVFMALAIFLGLGLVYGF